MCWRMMKSKTGLLNDMDMIGIKVGLIQRARECAADEAWRTSLEIPQP